MYARGVLVLAAALLVAWAGAARAADDYETAFQERARYLITKRAAEDPVEIMEWADRIDLGDPHKYALGPILARLTLDPADAKALRAYRMLMEVDKGKADRGLYHFAAYYRARLFAQFRDVLPEDILASNRHDVRHFFPILTRGGTDNHAWMHRASGAIWSELVPGPYESDSERATQAWVRGWVRDQTRRLYHVGHGEYDSSSYVCFSAASVANLYDFTSDPGTKRVARAALDWFATSIARKYFHGCNMGPEARGFARGAVASNTDWLGWLWFGDAARPVPTDAEPKSVAKHAAIVLALSTYRPHPAIRGVARKEVRLPYEARGSKPVYYGGPTEGGNKDQEVLWVGREAAMTTLYSPEKGVRTSGTILPQTTMFKVCLRGPDDVHVFGASNGYHRHFPLEGRTPYDQYHQAGPAALNVCHVGVPEDERTKHRSIFGVPAGAGEATRDGGWWFWQVGRAYLAARPLNGRAAFAEIGFEQKGDDATRWLVSPGALTGWAVQVGEGPEVASLDAFRRAVLGRVRLDLTRFEADRDVTMTSLDGRTLRLRHTGGPGGRPEAWTDGQRVSYEGWPVFASPWVNEPLGSGVLTVRDGTRTVRVDFSGDAPVITESGGDGSPAKGE